METHKNEKYTGLPPYPTNSAFPHNCEKFIKFPNGKVIYATKNTLEHEEKLNHEKNVAHQLIQTMVAITSLKETIATTLLFKAAYLSIFAKGDDKMIFDRIDNTVGQLQQVLQKQTVTNGYDLASLFFSPQTMFQIICNEIVEHFLTAVSVIEECILGRKKKDKTSFSSTSNTTLTFFEIYTQTWRWTGWKQIGMTALCSLSIIPRLISDCKTKFGKDESVVENMSYLDEFDKIAKCLSLIVKGFMRKKYPTSEDILSVFKDDDILNEKDLKSIEFDEEDVNEGKGEKENNNNGTQRGTLSSIFGRLY